MSPEDTKAALRNLINVTIKGDADGEGAKIVHDVLQAKMQARIAGPDAADEEVATESEAD